MTGSRSGQDNKWEDSNDVAGKATSFHMSTDIMKMIPKIISEGKRR